MDTTIPLRNLVHSPLNVRKTDPDAELAEMADSIHERGLLQNLVVCPALADDTEQPGLDRMELPDIFEVIAGGRRHRGLLRNVKLGRIDIDYPVPVLITPRKDGRETSLTENRERIAMNPVDEIEAFADIVERYEGTHEERVHQCARRFGVTDRYVAQRLALAALAPEILDALRADQISLDAAKAYAAYGDPTLQLTVFAAESNRSFGHKHDPRNIRDAMRSRTYPAKIPQALYVGHLAYLAAGGRIDRDLFMGADEDDKLLDPSIVDRLAREKAEGDLPGQVKVDGFASGILLGAFVIHAAWPKPPSGFVRALAPPHDQLTKKARKTMIGVYSLKGDGTGLDCVGYFKPLPDQPAAAGDGVPALATADNSRAPTRAIEFAGTDESRILRCAARLAIAAIEPPVLRDRVVWSDTPFVETDDDRDTFLIDVQLRVTRAEVDAMRDAAEQQLQDDARQEAA